MINPTMLRMIVEVHHGYMLEEARKSARPKATSRRANSRLHERLLLLVGDLLIAAGTRLQARYRSAMVPCPEPAGEWCLRQAGWHQEPGI